MMLDRRSLFTRLKALKPDGRFTPDDVKVIDGIADELMFARLPEAPSEALKPSRSALETIKRFEGCELTAYPDPGSGGDPWTIGWGSTGPGIRKGVVWTQQQADDRLKADVESFAEGVAKLVRGVQTTQSQFDALVSFSYNVGLKALADSTLLRMHRAGEFVGAKMQFERWNKASGKVLGGLVKRRAAEAELYAS